MNAEEQFPKIRVVLRAGRLVREDLYKMSPPTPTKENFKPSAISQIDKASTNHPAHGLVLPPEDNSDPLDTMVSAQTAPDLGELIANCSSRHAKF